MSASVLELREVAKTYPGEPPVHALHAVSLTIEPGELLAVVGQPSIVLADEPTGNLDSASGAAIVRLLHQLNTAGVTIAVVTHDRDLAAALPRRVQLLDGRIRHDSGRLA